MIRSHFCDTSPFLVSWVSIWPMCSLVPLFLSEQNFVGDLLAKSRGLLSWSCRWCWRRTRTVVDMFHDLAVDVTILVRCGAVCRSIIGKCGGGLDSVRGSDLPWPLNSIDEDVPSPPRVHRNAVQMSKLTTRDKPFNGAVVDGHSFNVLETNRLRIILPSVVFQIPYIRLCINPQFYSWITTNIYFGFVIDRSEVTNEI